MRSGAYERRNSAKKDLFGAEFGAKVRVAYIEKNIPCEKNPFLDIDHQVELSETFLFIVKFTAKPGLFRGDHLHLLPYCNDVFHRFQLRETSGAVHWQCTCYARSDGSDGGITCLKNCCTKRKLSAAGPNERWCWGDFVLPYSSTPIAYCMDAVGCVRNGSHNTAALGVQRTQQHECLYYKTLQLLEEYGGAVGRN